MEMDTVDAKRAIDSSREDDNLPPPAAARMNLSTGRTEPKQPPALQVNVDAPIAIANEPRRLITPVDTEAIIESAIGTC